MPKALKMSDKQETVAQILDALDRPIAFIGMMAAGKTRIGSMLARKTGLEFIDCDAEIEKAADCSVPEIFERFGERYFRDGERRVIARLIRDSLDKKTPVIISTGGGAVMTPETANLIWENTVSVWVRADMETTIERVKRNIAKRPMLSRGDPEEILEKLVKERYPIYEKADIVIESSGGQDSAVLSHTLAALHEYLCHAET